MFSVKRPSSWFGLPDSERIRAPVDQLWRLWWQPPCRLVHTILYSIHLYSVGGGVFVMFFLCGALIIAPPPTPPFTCECLDLYYYLPYNRQWTGMLSWLIMAWLDSIKLIAKSFPKCKSSTKSKIHRYMNIYEIMIFMYIKHAKVPWLYLVFYQVTEGCCSAWHSWGSSRYWDKS